MLTRISTKCLFTLALAGYLAAADNPFAGTWKLNPTKSNFTGDTATYERTPSGDIRFSGAGMSYTFKTDGREYPALFGYTATWKQIDDHTWETLNKSKGKLISTDTSKLSSDGKTMTIHSKGTKPNGEAFEDTAVYERVSGDSGLLGKWKSKQLKISSPNTLQLTTFEADGLTMTYVEWKATCSGKLDGKDYPFTGPTVPAGFTRSLKRTGPRTLEVTDKQNGKPLFTYKYTLSADGRMLAEVGRPVAVDEPMTAVYERQ